MIPIQRSSRGISPPDNRSLRGLLRQGVPNVRRRRQALGLAHASRREHVRLLIVTIRIALRALRRNTLRSLLTILGIIIGVAAVIAMVSIGQGASVAVQEQIARMGNNMLVILSGSVTQGGVRTGAGGRSTLRVSDAKAIQRECPAVRAVTYLRRQVQQVVVGNQNWSTSISGVTPEYQTVRDWPLAA